MAERAGWSVNWMEAYHPRKAPFQGSSIKDLSRKFKKVGRWCIHERKEISHTVVSPMLRYTGLSNGIGCLARPLGNSNLSGTSMRHRWSNLDACISLLPEVESSCGRCLEGTSLLISASEQNLACKFWPRRA